MYSLKISNKQVRSLLIGDQVKWGISGLSSQSVLRKTFIDLREYGKPGTTGSAGTAFFEIVVTCKHFYAHIVRLYCRTNTIYLLSLLLAGQHAMHTKRVSTNWEQLLNLASLLLQPSNHVLLPRENDYHLSIPSK